MEEVQEVRSGLELHDSRISDCEFRDGTVRIHFSHAYIHKSAGSPGRDPGTGWSQEAVLGFEEANTTSALPRFPNTIVDGYLSVGGIRHEIIPLPFRRKVAGELRLEFSNGDQLAIAGKRPYVELIGPARFVEEVP